MQSTDIKHIIDDDNIGHVSTGGAFCLEMSSLSSLEVWSGLLSGPRWAVALFNRSPSSDTITIDFNNLPDVAKHYAGAGAGARVGAGTKGRTFVVKDVWSGTAHSTPVTSYSAIVGAHDTALLIVTPSSAGTI